MAYSPPTVDPLPEGACAEVKNEIFKQEGALAFYNKRKNEKVLCQFINCLDKDLKEVLIRQDDLLERPVESILKQISTLEEEQGVTKKVSAAMEMPVYKSKEHGDLEDIVQNTVEQKVEEMFKKAAVVKKGGKHGAPEQLHHDQGKNLTAEIIREVCSFLEIWNTRTTLFHPQSDQSDGASERSIRTVNNMLAKVVAEDQRNWDLYVSSTCFAYNTAVHSTTGYTPSYLEYGRELRLPSDLVMNDQQTPQNNSHTEYATELKKRLAKAFECSRETLESSHRTQKHYYDRWARGNVYKEGDLVMWKDQKTRNGRCMKLNKPWTGPWKVIKRLGEVVYRIKYIGSNKVGLKRRIVHHNQLKRFYETTGSQEEPVQSEQISGQLVANDGDTVESRSDVVIVVDGPGADDEHEIQQREVEQVVLEPEGRPQRQCRPPAWLVPYEINI